MAKRSDPVVAEICLYGNAYAAGWLVKLADGLMFGDGEARDGRGLTMAVWLACDAIREAGVTSGLVEVYAPGGRQMATIRLEGPKLYFGRMEWKPAKVYVLSYDQILAASEGCQRV